MYAGNYRLRSWEVFDDNKWLILSSYTIVCGTSRNVLCVADNPRCLESMWLNSSNNEDWWDNLDIDVWVKPFLEHSLSSGACQRFVLVSTSISCPIYRMNGTGLRPQLRQDQSCHERICLFVAGLENLAHWYLDHITLALILSIRCILANFL